ncbi:MAG: hypothetical protein GXP49_05550 [Deltaproteobacteria bacterium]|nr:hypothetical protein [Deltaproteobacteria bacterium]
MAFSRAVLPAERPTPGQLSSAMAGIGMRFASRPDWGANIEDTLLFASEVGMESDDLRVLSVLATWLGVHAAWVNADRLVRIAREHESERVRAFWSAVGSWRSRDRRFARLEKVYNGHKLDLLSVGTEFQLSRRGEDPRFAGSAMRVPAGVLRDRQDDVLDPDTLSQRHLTYRFRVIIGPTYRADMWAALEQDPTLSPAELARRTYGSFATAWQVRRDYMVVHGPGVATGKARLPSNLGSNTVRLPGDVFRTARSRRP